MGMSRLRMQGGRWESDIAQRNELNTSHCDCFKDLKEQLTSHRVYPSFNC
jgi:hypothetical protein